MNDLINKILEDNTVLKIGDEVRVISNSTGHNYPLGSICKISAIQSNPGVIGGVSGYNLIITANNFYGNIAGTGDVELINPPKISKKDIINELTTIIELFNEIPDVEFESYEERKKIIKKFKSYRFLKLFNSAKTEYDKLKILDDLIK